jgi:hypothetical protein
MTIGRTAAPEIAQRRRARQARFGLRPSRAVRTHVSMSASMSNTLVTCDGVTSR